MKARSKVSQSMPRNIGGTFTGGVGAVGVAGLAGAAAAGFGLCFPFCGLAAFCCFDLSLFIAKLSVPYLSGGKEPPLKPNPLRFVESKVTHTQWFCFSANPSCTKAA
jgi:hypothetical protein